ncbi:MAG: TSUP family transporter [Angelakisella sp.]|nr:TSUP family transporter [Angelakisella sp.]
MRGALSSFLPGLLAGALGSMGLGGGGVLLLWLSYVGTGQLTAQGINLLFILPVGAVGLWLHRKNGLVDIKAALPIALGGLIGLVLGTGLAGWLSNKILSKLFAILIGIMAIRELSDPTRRCAP